MVLRMELEGRLVGVEKDLYGGCMIMVELDEKEYSAIEKLYQDTPKMVDIWIKMKTEVRPED